MPQLPYVTLNVFTTQPLTSGNPLAVVTIPPSTTISKTQEHLIAREFGYSETIFIYPSSSLRPEQQNEGYTKIAIWTVLQEIPFAGHPTVGAGWYLGGEGKKEGELLIPAGRLKYEKNVDGRVRIDTPHKITLWGRTVSRKRIGEIVGVPVEEFGGDEGEVFENSTVGVVRANNVFENWVTSTTTASSSGGGWDVNGIPVVSIVDGMTFALVEVKSVSVLQAMKVGRKGVVLDMVTDLGAMIPPGGRTFIGVYCYTILEETIQDGVKGRINVRSRMFFGGDGEDPATGSAACALGSYLAIAKGSGEGGKGVGEWEFEVTQGVEMGRRSDIGVRVLLEDANADGKRGVKKVYLEGEAVKVMEGVLTI
ncbi:hypothetical protein TWF569_003681 [Orbilia oligospora]|uniref:Phenazine biosynthesis protein n=1 Tax=Orbilia oligospora TaxID=2813651 RepID=A0A7C8NFM9_ORBOL|nr:hypothetical protein TWF103_010723 [Orbilia oligospora]KAF3095417.1 hypothetical protein TWF706_007940 [Orbilia oligospora]KAF3106380.1 hypothetical protein TWF102_001345 [Orbilia oligospora]KAF3151544.1 hypothetical protein TWF569_003681 [Orbilia oligospora]